MNDIKFSLWAAGWLLILLLAGSCKSANESRAPVALTWEMGSYDGNGKYYENSFVLKNVSDAPIGKDWEIYYSQFPRSIRQDASSPVRVEEVNATLFKIYPGEGFLSLAKSSWKVKASCFSNTVSPPVTNTFFTEGMISVVRNSGVSAFSKRR